ncbi:MAG: helix-turn-helix domain-containing protein [Vulcanimicrobiota bacterium]
MIKQRRISLGIRQKTLAAHLQISAAALSRYERGERLWPPDLYNKAVAALGFKSLSLSDCYWTWKQHRRWWDSWEIETDPGQTWADLDKESQQLTRATILPNQPPLEFKRHMRADSRLEAGGYASLCAAGAAHAYISLVAMSFPHHPLITEKRSPMSMARRAALLLDDWILWPQINLLVHGRKVRVDLIAYNGRRWVAVELDGVLHQGQRLADQKRDQALGFSVIRLTQEEVVSGDFVYLLRSRLNGLPE